MKWFFGGGRGRGGGWRAKASAGPALEKNWTFFALWTLWKNFGNFGICRPFCLDFGYFGPFWSLSGRLLKSRFTNLNMRSRRYFWAKYANRPRNPIPIRKNLRTIGLNHPKVAKTRNAIFG